MLFNKLRGIAALVGAGALAVATASAQDSGPLIDLLIKKGIVTDQEAEDLRADLQKDFAANSSAGKLNLSSSLTEFKISGDIRMRHQIETQAPELATGGYAVSNEQSRERFRFRLNGDVILQKGWTAGFALETGQASDSANQTFTGAADDYSIFVARAYVGWQPNLNWQFVVGKQKNPFYTTDLRWDADINPQGAYEDYKYFEGAKDTIEVRAMQHIQEDRPESVPGPLGRDAWQFEQQLVYTHWFGPESLNSVILAPGFSVYNQSSISTALQNSNAFIGSTRGQQYLTFAGEVNWANIAGAATFFKAYWDSSYNLLAGTRAYHVYNVNSSQFNKGADAWLVGVSYGYGTGKVQGDYSFKLDYRRVGLASVDVNENDSDWAFGKVNQEGWKAGVLYNLTDFVNLAATYYYTTKIQSGLTYALGNLDHSQELQLDLVIKF